MRVLLGGLIGAAASAAAWFFIEYTAKQEFGWMAIAVGVVTGLCVNAGAPKGAPQSYGRAALAVLLTMVAIVGGRMVYANVMRNISQVTTVVAPSEKNATDEPEGDEPAAAVAASSEQEATVAREEERGASGALGSPRMAKPTASSYKELEVVWMAVAALAAYLTGKGSGKPGPTTVDAEPSTPEGTAPA